MAASREAVQRHLYLIERTKVEIDYVNVEPCALLSCFAHLLDENQEKQGATMFIDLGHVCTKVVVSHGTKIAFSRNIRVAAENIRRTICDKSNMNYNQAVHFHKNILGQISAQTRNQKDSLAMADSVKNDQPSQQAVATMNPNDSSDMVSEHIIAEKAIMQALDCLAEEIRSCIRYHDLHFGTEPIRKVVFLGGQSKNRVLCQNLARHLGLPAQLGDPLVRVDTKNRTGKHSDVPPGESYPDWAVAFGLSLGGVEAN
jgi:Tfp pilus assembly PilM family ATPase